MSQPQNTTAEATEGREDPILSVRDLQTVFYTDNETIRAVDSISFDVGRGETVGIVGESGSGKSVTARSIMGLIESPGKVLPGSSISFDGQELTDLSEKQYQSIRGSGIGMVFQDPNSRLTPSTLSATRSVNRLQSTAISRVKRRPRRRRDCSGPSVFRMPNAGWTSIHTSSPAGCVSVPSSR